MKALPWILVGVAVLAGVFMFMRRQNITLLPSSAPTAAPPVVINSGGGSAETNEWDFLTQIAKGATQVAGYYTGGADRT